MIKNVIFDYGSVLIKTDCRRVYTAYFGSWEKATWFRDNIISEQWLRRLDIGEDYKTCIADLQAIHPEYAEAIALYDSRFTDFLVGAMPGMTGLLSRLHDKGIRLFGLSNFSHKIYEIEKRVPLFRFLEGQIISSDVHLIKPDPRIFKLLLSNYGLKAEESLFVDDRQQNIEAARSVGMSALLFPTIPFTQAEILAGFPPETPSSTLPPELSEFISRMDQPNFPDSIVGHQ